MSPGAYGTLADLVLMVHAGFVFFVILGLVAILTGGAAGWRWISNPWFRLAHLAAIAVVATQSWFGMLCPLTTLEMNLRDKAGDATYSGSFVAHWMERLLYYEAPPWVFVTCYTAFGLAVVFAWVKFRPRPFRRSQQRESAA